MSGHWQEGADGSGSVGRHSGRTDFPANLSVLLPGGADRERRRRPAKTSCVLGPRFLFLNGSFRAPMTHPASIAPPRPVPHHTPIAGFAS